ncbi:DeoR/GlpR transcriptional regulator [Gordonia sp. TBRC 11910]|uniref:Lactose phosphotransferase system repressor n=1 Tax=Gordonia asplenii TaxID=2725283 RepID=A0A848KS12_9ACTN|nr:DeoR/GlpR transcriptional regulator [Gordonia asplenii]
MGTVERQARIVAMVRAQESVEIGELTKTLDVSRETVRKDLYQLDRAGLLTKVRGGAVLTSGNHETAYVARRTSHAAAKRAIARAAAQLVGPADTVFLDYGTTTYAIAEELVQLEGITVVTNALPIANLLVPNVGITVILPGGVVRANEGSVYGPLTENNLAQLHMDWGFFGCGGVHRTNGVTNHDMFETAISRLAIAHSTKVILVADHTKFGVAAQNKTAELNTFDLVITDSQAPADILGHLRDIGVPTDVVDPSTSDPEPAQTERGEDSQ